jgi:hypothetical protein
MDLSHTTAEILSKEGYTSPEHFVRDSALLIALSKIDRYKAECDFFKQKYGMELEDLEADLRKVKGMEDFKKEEDLEDWEFASGALKWWQEKVDELRSSKAD